MKRILCAVCIPILVLALFAHACAEPYTHPAAGFHLTVPEGWLAVDSANVEETINAGRVSAGMAATMASIRGILDSTLSVFLFKEDAAEPPFVNVSVELKGELDVEITLDDLLETARAYEAYYLENHEQFPGYAVSVPAGAETVEGWYSMGYLGGVYEISGYQIALMQVFVAAGTQFYEFTLTAEEDKASDAGADFGDLVGSFAAPYAADPVAGPAVGPQPALETDQFVFDGDTLDSVPAVAGARERTMKESGSGLGYENQAYTYASASVRDDLLAYIDYLGEKGFTIVQGAPLDEPGSGVLEGPSASPGARLQVDLSWTEADYRISVTKKTRTASAESPRIDPGLLARGEELLDAGAYDEALALFDEAVAAQPYVPAYYLKHGNALFGLGRLEESVESFSTAIMLDLKNWEHYAERGVSYYFLGETEAALADFLMAVDLGPADDMTYHNLAYIQAETGTPEDAVMTCAFGLAEYPDSPDLWYVLGNIQLSLGNYSQALAAYDKMIEYGYCTAEDLGEGYAEAKEKAGMAGKPDEPEALAYRNGSYGLAFTLPEGWYEIPDEDRAVFSGPDGSDSMLLIGLTGQRVDDAFAVFFSAAIAEKWMRESRLFEDIAFTEFTPILFASAMGGNGRLYAMHMCRFAGEGFPDGYKLLYAQMFFTDENGMLGDMSMLTPATEDSALPLFDAVVMENIPQDVWTELNAQIGARMSGQD